MISQLHIENFRSIEKATLDLGRITVLTGSNNSGKSSLMYGLFCLKYLALNPNRPLNDIFNIPNVINLGGFFDVVFDGKKDRAIGLRITLEDEITLLSNSIKISEHQINAQLEIKKPFKAIEEIEFSLPYLLDKSIEFKGNEYLGAINYNGFYFSNLVLPHSDETNEPSYDVLKSLNSLNDFSSNVELISTRRGFTKPVYAMVPLQSETITEDEIATELALNNTLEQFVCIYLARIAERGFYISRVNNSGIFYLKTLDTQTKFVNNLVNEGTGTNQLVTILAKALNPKKKFICIDEPEIHLHPSMIEKLVEALVEIAYEQDKQFLLSTHSEHFVTCLLSEVVKKKLQPEDLKVYYLTKEGKSTHIENQTVYADGQIEGGLKNFYESELKNLETFFKIA